MEEGGGCRLLDTRSKEREQLAEHMQAQYDERLFIAIQATQKVKRRGQTSAMKSRILAVTHHDEGRGAMLYCFKAGGKSEKEKLSLKTRLPFTPHTLSAGETGTVLVVRVDADESVHFSVTTEASRDFFLSSCTQHLRERGRQLRAAPEDALGNGSLFARADTSAAEDHEERRDILTTEDMKAIARVVNRAPCGGAAAELPCDARELRDRVRALSGELREANSTAIINAEKDWTALIASFEGIAVGLSDVQIRLMQFTNNLGKQGDEIARVERERGKQAVVQTNHAKLVHELNAISTQINEAAPRLAIVESRDMKKFLPERRGGLLEAMSWLAAFEKREIVQRYNTLRAVKEVFARTQKSKADLGHRLFEFLRFNFKEVGSALVESAKRARTRPRFARWPHRAQQASWREFEPLMPSVLRLPLTDFLELCRTYSVCMQESYNVEIPKDYEFLRHTVKKRNKEMFYLGAGTKELMGLNLLTEMQSQAGGTSYAGSVYSGDGSLAGRSRGMSNAGSGCGYSSDGLGTGSGAEPVPTRLQEHGLVLYRHDEIWDLAEGGGFADLRSRASRDSGGSSDGAGSWVGGSATLKLKPGKRPLLAHGVLIQCLLASAETALRESEFIEAMFGLGPTTDQHVDMLKKIFNACPKNNTTVLDAEFTRLLHTMNSGGKKKPRVDMMALLPLGIVAEQLAKAPIMERSPFILSFLSKIQREIDTALLVWQGQQIDVIRKYTCTIKHKVVLPCYIRFSVFIKRVMEMCDPIPLPASFTKVQNVLAVVCEAMLDSLASCCKTDKKYADLFFLKNATYYLDYLREVQEAGAPLTKLLLSKEMEKMPKLQSMRAQAEAAYIDGTLVQDRMSDLFHLLVELEGCMNSYGAEEVPMRFQVKKVGEQLKHANVKDVRKSLTAIIDRQNKHFFEHTPSNDGFLKGLFRATWAAAENIITDRWRRLEALLSKCYPTLAASVCTSQQLAGILRELPQPNLEDHAVQPHGWQLPPRMPQAPPTWAASSRASSAR